VDLLYVPLRCCHAREAITYHEAFLVERAQR